MNKVPISILMLAALFVTSMAVLGTPVFGDSTGTPGQPNQECQDFFPSGPLSPSGFNTQGFQNAEDHYEGNGQNTQTLADSHAVSQYDVACFQAAQHLH